jgi:hypothetical protein
MYRLVMPLSTRHTAIGSWIGGIHRFVTVAVQQDYLFGDVVRVYLVGVGVADQVGETPKVEDSWDVIPCGGFPRS